jgi:hypothetical protein
VRLDARLAQPGAKMDCPVLEPEGLHRFKNLLGISLGFCDLLLKDVAPTDPRRADIVQIQEALREAVALVPTLFKRP